MSPTVQSTIDDNADLIETFVSRYLFDEGIGVQIVEVIAKELFGQVVVVNGTVSEDVATNPRALYAAALADIVDVGVFGSMDYNLDTLVAGAASFEFLVRYARKVNPIVLPPEVIPSDEVVGATLELFHTMQKPVST